MKLELNPQEATCLFELMDAGVRHFGLQKQKMMNAMVLLDKLNAAIQQEQNEKSTPFQSLVGADAASQLG